MCVVCNCDDARGATTLYKSLSNPPPPLNDPAYFFLVRSFVRFFFDFHVFLVLVVFNSLGVQCSWLLLISDTPTAWSTNPINDSILRDERKRKQQKKWLHFCFRLSKHHNKCLEALKNNHNILFKTSTIREKKIRHHKLRQKEGPGQSGERNGNDI